MWYLDSGGGGGAVEITKLEKKVSGISILLLLIAMIQQFLMIMYLQTTAEIVR